MQSLTGYNCKGNDAQNLYSFAGNEEDCQNECLKRSYCGASAYLPINDTATCRIKYKAGPLIKDDVNTCSVKLMPYVRLEGTDTPDNDLASQKVKSEDECTQLCDANVNCDTSVYAPKEQYCWLKQKYGKSYNYTANSDRHTTLHKPYYDWKNEVSKTNYVPSMADYNKYKEKLASYQDANYVKSAIESNSQRLGNTVGKSVVEPTAMEEHKERLKREAKQKMEAQMATAHGGNMNDKLSGAYDQLIDENIDGINSLDHMIENKSHLIKANNKEAKNKNKSIYILSYFLLLLLLLSVLFLCVFLSILSPRNALILAIMAALVYIFKIVHKYYWNGVDSEAVALKKMIYTGAKDMGEDIRDAVLPKWVYSCPKRCKKRDHPSHMRRGPGDNTGVDEIDMKTDSGVNVWAEDIKNPTMYNCQWQGPAEDVDPSQMNITTSIPCDKLLGYKEVRSN